LGGGPRNAPAAGADGASAQPVAGHTLIGAEFQWSTILIEGHFDFCLTMNACVVMMSINVHLR
jgi:hypothetical protein